MSATEHDGRTRCGGERIEETTIAVASKRVAWDYQPAGPFKVQRWHHSGRATLTYWSRPFYTLAEALEELATAYLPCWTGFAVEVVDERFVGVFGVSAQSDVAEALCHAWGVERAFAILTEHAYIDPVTLAVWEINARRMAPGG